jgi:DNA-binding HxlR family transcriptional regulator
MYKRKTSEDLDCGVRAAFKVFGGKWKLCIIDAIHKGIARPCDIHKYVGGTTLRVVEMQLAELLAFEVVEKCSNSTYPLKSEYKLTDLGKTILPLLTQIEEWGNVNSSFVKERSESMV